MKCIIRNLGSNKKLRDGLGACLWKLRERQITVKDYLLFFSTANRRNKMRERETFSKDL